MSKKNPTETEYAVGMARGGVVWWKDGEQYVDLMRADGEVMMIALGRSDRIRHPDLARSLFLTFAAERLGLRYSDAELRFYETPIDPFWDDLASVLIQSRSKKGG